MSNTAHDIKSPTAAISLAFEALDSIVTGYSDTWRRENELVLELFREASKTVAFLEMTINRSMDYTTVGGRIYDVLNNDW